MTTNASHDGSAGRSSHHAVASNRGIAAPTARLAAEKSPIQSETPRNQLPCDGRPGRRKVRNDLIGYCLDWKPLDTLVVLECVTCWHHDCLLQNQAVYLN